MNNSGDILSLKHRSFRRRRKICLVESQSERPLCYFHFVMDTSVPSPTLLRIVNSLTSRLDPLKPRPKPPPVVYPSVMASSRSGMPGPRSLKVRRKPRRVPFPTISIATLPPSPCCRVLRANSLAAVMMRVWSTRLNRNSSALARTAWRTATSFSPESFCRDYCRGVIDACSGAQRPAATAPFLSQR